MSGSGGVVMAKVYVSSTIADLKRERRAVMEWLVAAGHQPVHSYLPYLHPPVTARARFGVCAVMIARVWGWLSLLPVP